jgi:hypothetical protein
MKSKIQCDSYLEKEEKGTKNYIGSIYGLESKTYTKFFFDLELVTKDSEMGEEY